MRNANFTANTTCQDSRDYINKCAPIAEADDTNRNKSSSRPRRHRSRSANEDREAKRAAAFFDRFAGFSEPGGMARGFWAGPAAIANRPGDLSPLPKSSGARIARQAAHSRRYPEPRRMTAPCRARIAGRGLPGVDCGRATGRAAHSPARKSGDAVHRAGSRGTALHDGKNNAFSGRPRRRPAPCAPCDPPAGRARRLTPPTRPAARSPLSRAAVPLRAATG